MVTAFLYFRDELALEDDFVFCGVQIVTPVKLQSKYIQQLYKMHQIADSKLKSANSGLSERAVGSAKELVRKCKKDHSNPRYALLLLRNTPRDNTLKSQAERLFSRKTNIALPTTEQAL